MPSTKIYARRSALGTHQKTLSDVIQSCVTDFLKFPAEIRLQRFFMMEDEDFIFGEGRSEMYLVIELSMFEGRSVQTIKGMINAMYERITAATPIPRSDIDITIHEVPRHCWGLQGEIGDEKKLAYDVSI